MKQIVKQSAIWIVAALVVAGVVGVTGTQLGESETTPPGGTDRSLASAVPAGRATYDANCAGCHGSQGFGTDKGPPLVHPIYNPGHHSDASFARAVSQGVRQHHWKFGDMPAQPQVTQQQFDAIVRHVREMQESHGITYQPHKM